MAVEVTPKTNRIIQVANGANELFVAAENNPEVKKDLQMLFDSVSKGGAISPGLLAYLVTVIGTSLQQHGVTVDSQLLGILIGGAVTGVSFLWQVIAIRLQKPAAKP